ncbi:hypothetical protein KKH43_04000 [Patescibacteria group bacterium]|nr:hypothetical protein [Patescibacteria group bacterium]
MNAKVWIVIIIAVVLAGALCGSAVYFWQGNTCRVEKNELIGQMQDLNADVHACEKEIDEVAMIPKKMDDVKVDEPAYKDITVMGGYTAEVPDTWSVTTISESIGENSLPDLPTQAISPSDVSFGDIHAGQVDFFYAQNDIVDTLIEEEKNQDDSVKTTWTTEDIAGFEAQVVEYDPNSDIKGAGSKKYFVTLDGVDVSGFDVKTMMMYVHGDDDPEYQAELEKFFQSITK